MMNALSAWRDRFLGRGDSSVTVPPLDGALKPNNLLEDASVGFEIKNPDNLVSTERGICFTSGPDLHVGGKVAARFQTPITALAASEGGRMAVATADDEVRVLGAGFKSTPGAIVKLNCVTALAFRGEQLLASVGSAGVGTSEWQRDLLNQGRSGSVWAIDSASGKTVKIAANLAWPYGLIAERDGSLIVSEAWRKRLVRIGSSGKVAAQLIEDLPGYPSRIVPSGSGGYWLCIFAPRSQLIEFVLREHAYRRAMMAEVKPEYWIAPALSSGVSFHEPMQGGALKQMGILKPWAPTRSYGLVIELNPDFIPVRSLHSRAGGKRHGITSAAEHDGKLWLSSKGGDEVLMVLASQTD